MFPTSGILWQMDSGTTPKEIDRSIANGAATIQKYVRLNNRGITTMASNTVKKINVFVFGSDHGRSFGPRNRVSIKYQKSLYILK